MCGARSGSFRFGIGQASVCRLLVGLRIGFLGDSLKREHLESVFLLVLVGVLLWTGIAALYDYRLSHSSPWGYFASDAIHNLYQSQNLYDVGNWKYVLPYIAAGYADVVSYMLPMLAHLNVNLAYASGLAPSDTLMFLCVLLSVVSALLMYILIKDYNGTVALLSAPIFAFLFLKNFYTAITWGQLTYLAGSFFLIASVVLLRHLKEKGIFVPFAILVSAIFLAHTSEFFFFLGFVVVYLLYDLLFKKTLNLTLVKKLALSAVLVSLISFYYMVIFFNSYYANYGPSSFKWFTVVSDAGFRIAYLSDFGWLFLLPILVGFAVSLYLIFKKKAHLSMLFASFMLFVGLLNYIGIGNRSFQTRFFWPVYLSVFFGIFLYQCLKLFMKRENSLFVSIASLAILVFVVISFQARNLDQGLLNPYHWDAYQWLKSDTPTAARVYFFYGDTFDQNAQLLIPARFATYAMNKGIAQNLNDMIIPRDFFSRFLVNAEFLPYRKSFFSFGYHLLEENISTEHLVDVCNYDYYVFDKSSAYYPALAQYNLAIRQVMLGSGFTEEVYSNELVSILENMQPGKDCIPKEGVKLK
ncbi:MAG: hypothetical protein V1837_08510 [Candidatus Woesearchaeota archaeon]